MIKFFRRIRQHLLSENKFSKYLIYAIGEIILVVIGIMIALQINTWNQNRIDLNVQKAIISKLHKDFKQNKKSVEEFIIANHDQMNAQMVLMNLIGASNEELDKYNLDSLLYTSFGANELYFADNTLRNIMNSGQLNLIKNEDISLLLYEWNQLSEIRKLRIEKLDAWANGKFIPYLLSKISFKEMDVNANLKWGGKSKVKPKYHSLFQELKFENYLDNNLWFHNEILKRCNESEILIDKIIDATTPKSI